MVGYGFSVQIIGGNTVNCNGMGGFFTLSKITCPVRTGFRRIRFSHLFWTDSRCPLCNIFSTIMCVKK